MARQTEIIEHDGRDMPSDPLSLATRMQPDHQLVSERTLFGDVIMAQPTKAPRDEARIVRKIDQMSAAMGAAWMYRFPVKTKGGGTNYIEGLSIDGAMAVSRYYGNCRVDSAVVDGPPGFWTIHSRFIDLETGYTLIRPFVQSKAGSRLGGDDDERRLQIAFSIGVSKSQRNVVDRAIRDLCDRALEGAKKGTVERIGRNLPEARERLLRGLQQLGVDVARVERIYGRKFADMLAPDLARLVAEMKSVADGMASPDETWPLEPPREPRRSDVETSSAQPTPPGDSSAAPGPGRPQPVDPVPGEGSSDNVEASAPDVTNINAPKNWTVGDDVIGQADVIRRLHELIDIAQSEADVDEIERQNAERIAKITGNPGATLRLALRDKRISLTRNREG